MLCGRVLVKQVLWSSVLLYIKNYYGYLYKLKTKETIKIEHLAAKILRSGFTLYKIVPRSSFELTVL